MKMRVGLTRLGYFTLRIEVSMGWSVNGLKRLATISLTFYVRSCNIFTKAVSVLTYFLPNQLAIFCENNNFYFMKTAKISVYGNIAVDGNIASVNE